MKIKHLAIFLLLCSVLPSIFSTAQATRPISGQTIEFTAAGSDTGTSSGDANGVVAADLNHDGDIDLISSDQNGNLILYQNDGSPFSGVWAQITIGNSAAAAIRGTAVGDLDNDGHLDLASAAEGINSNVEIWQNDATPFSGAWTSRIAGSIPANTHAIGLGDLDRDGNLDIVVASAVHTGAEITLFQNDGTPFSGSWASHGVINTLAAANNLVLIDLDTDGDLDIISVCASAEDYELIGWQNDGTPFTGVWIQANLGASTTDLTTLDLGDFDDDGDLDIVTGGTGAEITLWENDGTPFTGAWSATVADTGSNPVSGLQVMDLDNDGDLDLAGSDSSGILTAWQNDGTPFTGAWEARQIANTSISMRGALAAQDFDKDGDIDLVTAGAGAEDYELIGWRNDQVHHNAPFADSEQALGIASSSSANLGDLDADGDLDAFVANPSANSIWLNDGSGVFTDSGQNLGSNFSWGSALGDVDGDGDPDVFVANETAAAVWLNDGGGYFSDSGQTLGSGSYFDVGLGDLDADGDLDAFLAHNGSGNQVWRNDGGGTFTNSGQSLGSALSWGTALGDLDADGDLDAFVSNNLANKVWLNDGAGTFTDSGQSLGNAASSDVTLGDLDGDGDLDAFISNNSANIVWLNDGTGTFTDSGQSLGNAASVHTSLGDVDSDGDLDAFVANNGPTNRLWLNNGAGAFADSGLRTGLGNTWDTVMGDLDGDGDLDIFTAEDSWNKVWVNQSGSARLLASNTSPGGHIPDSTEDDVMKVIFSHNGVTGDRDLELNRWDLDLFLPDCTTPLTSSEANAFIDNLRVRLDDGDGLFETDGSDFLVADIADLSLVTGLQPVPFIDGDTNAQISIIGPASRTYWVSVRTTSDASTQTPNSFCMVFDPDADALVEGKTPDFSVSIQDTDPVDTMTVPTAVRVTRFSTDSPGLSAAPLLTLIFFSIVVGGVVTWKKRLR